MRHALIYAGGAVLIGLVGCSKPPKALPVIDPSRFDMVCDLISKVDGDPSPHHSQVRYNIDLSARQYMHTGDRMPYPIKDITNSDIVFEDTPATTMGWDHEGVDRYTGKYLGSLKVGGQLTKIDGDCVRSAFSGFPPRKF